MPVHVPTDLNGSYHEFCASVGALFLAWARLENSVAAGLKLHLQRRLGGEDELQENIRLACAIYGSMRLKVSRDTSKPIAAEEEFGEAAMAFHRDLFNHLGHIETLRDKLAHQGLRQANSEVQNGRWILMDAATTRAFASVKNYQIETVDVIRATLDLFNAANAFDGFFEVRHTGICPTLPTWQYNPSSLRLLPRRTRKTHTTPQHPPQPKSE